MYHHVKKLMYTVNIGDPDPRFGRMLLEQFGGANGFFGADPKGSFWVKAEGGVNNSSVGLTNAAWGFFDSSTVSTSESAGLWIGEDAFCGGGAFVDGLF